MTSTFKAGLVIIGGGGAGLAAALTAVEKGCKDVIVLEKRSKLGGTSAMAGGLFACGSPVQERQGIGTDADYLFKRAMEWAHWTQVDPKILRAFIGKSGDTIRWLERKGLEFDLVKLFPEQPVPVQHNPRGHGARLIQVLTKECREKGVQILLDSDVEKILRGKNGKITDVTAVRDGEDIKISTQAVIIATGGFCGNRRLFRKYFPSSYRGMTLSGLPLAGDGIGLAADVGAAIEDFATAIKEGPRYDLYNWPLMALEREPATLWINKNGERFTDESTGYRVFESVNAVLRQPGQVSYTLLDSRIRDYCEENGFMAGFLRNSAPGLEQELQAETEKGGVRIAGTWGAIADWIGIDPLTLEKTINEYNACCKKGHDGIFAKSAQYLLPLENPPYYAIRGMVVLLDTIGGVRINERMEVLNKDNEPVPGLFAAGVVTSGWESEVYCSELSASAFGFAVNSGRIAAENAVQY
ncbi:MAG: FAD-dependent oxidoreductase [Dehalococcoidales bacterium]|nr:FAD-dependent oxidoreductase [Dehalococcoidales bacterium]